MPSADEVKYLLAPHLLGDLREVGVRIEVLALDIEAEARTFTATFEIRAGHQRWRVRLPSGDQGEMAIFDGQPASDLVLGVTNALRIRLLEWCHTKDTERRSARLGVRLS